MNESIHITAEKKLETIQILHYYYKICTDGIKAEVPYYIFLSNKKFLGYFIYYY